MITKPHLVLGIDPGVNGALALYNRANQQVVDIFDMPTFSIKGKKKLDLVQLGFWIDMNAKSISLCAIEDVGVMTGKEGTVSMFNFGYSTGGIAGILAANLLPTVLIKPAVWKGAMGLGRDKDESRRKATSLFPASSHWWPMVKHDGRAEALLIAVFGSRYSLN